jgi:hypothetical protein
MSWPAEVPVVFLDRKEFREREDSRQAAVGAWREANLPDSHTGPWPEELKALDHSFFPPGSMWECPWYFDPFEDGAEEKAKRCLEALQANPSAAYHLSIHYWRDWAPWRPPLTVVCPDHRHWTPDSKSVNGDGWTVTGEPASLTCSPSIWTRMSDPTSFHGYLTNGVFRPC